MSRRLTDLERRFLTGPPTSLARIATVDSTGLPHVVPSGWSYDSSADELVLGGRDVPSTRRAAHVRESGRAAVVIDGVSDSDGWAPWALVVRGRARVAEDERVIRVALDAVTSWGLESVAVADPSGPSGPS